MAKRQTIGDNPLDLIVPRKPRKPPKRSPKKSGRKSAKTSKAEEAVQAVVKEAAAGDVAAEAGGGATGTEKRAEKAISRPHRLAPPGQYLTFLLAGEEYGAAILGVKEIIEYATLTTVPGTPPWVRGVINLRGSVVPVIDLAVKFGLPEIQVTNRTCIVIVEVEIEAELAIMGILADAVSQVVEFGAEDIEPAPAFGTQIGVDYLLGMGKMGTGFVLLLDKDRVLSLAEMMTLPDSAAHPGRKGAGSDAPKLSPAPRR